MMRRAIGFVGASMLAASAVAAPISYHENWDSYAVGLEDPTYNSVWALDDLAVKYPAVESGVTVFSVPNRVQILSGATRSINNNLADGVTNGTSNEMSPGQMVQAAGAVRGAVTDAIDPLNLLLGTYMHISTGTQRRKITGYVEISLGGEHAPIGAGALDPLASPIPVLALGRVNQDFTTSDGLLNGDNNSIYFFNGQQWIRTALGTRAASGGAGFNKMWLEIGATQVNVREDGLDQFTGAYDRLYLGGFDTVTLRNINSSGFSGTAGFDDVYLSGGNVVPEPSTLALLTLALPLLWRRRRA